MRAALDLFGRRWSLRLLWELRADPLGFRPLQKRCDGMSSSVLRQRLTELLAARVVRQLPDARYTLTPLGQEACQALHPLVRWADRWAVEIGSRTEAEQASSRAEGPIDGRSGDRAGDRGGRRS
ncbi:winged helix-turn-helix transcriptional regulator [Streptomyces rhizoryzae]|uniref:winged helix-turn-helix transcriptional regulator n=1 Tax=Streptomyces rhizoryzae TaxID=2932493 RepID=UPI0035570A90